MPPSPAIRCSPGREPRGDSHKRGRSFESAVAGKQRDDDLALFNEVQSREKDNFLLQADDDFEDDFTSKLRDFSDYKFGINIPARGESSDLLLAEEEKNDYEWLKSPPDTPLFPSLDDEVPQVNLAQRGRPRTQPISISRSSTMEKSHRSSRGSASPNRVSLSPRSHNSPFESRGVRAMSAPSASPPLKPSTSSLRSSPPSRKPVTPIPRASTPNSRRLSTGSNNSSGSRGSRGSSPSPKVKAWQSTIPGFSDEVPPNLRTSLADRPASYVRGSSPASRNSRQSMSPTASRSISSSHSKGSVGSSADDDVEPFSSVVNSGTQRLNSRRVGGFQNNINKKKPHQQFSKNASSMVSSSSAPKRSFDLALRQMDHRKGPQNMFRPLLSSAPSSSFHVGISMISSSPQNTMISMISRHSSVTTSSNASSALGLGGVHEPETAPDDVTSGPVKVQDPDVSDEVFVIEKDDDGLNESGEPTALTAALTFDGVGDIDSQTGLLICSRCGCWFSPIGLEEDTNLCGECMEPYLPLTIVDPVIESATAVDPQVAVVEVKPQSSQHDDLVKDGQSTYGEPVQNFLAPNSLSRSRSEECETKQVNHEVVDFPKSKVDSLEVAGISLVLKKSSSMKSTVVRNMNFSASSISYDDFSYARESTNNSMRSMSVSSSVDFTGVNRHRDTRFQRQSSSTKSEVESYKFELNNAKHNCSGSSPSRTSSHACHNEENDTSTPEIINGNEFQTHVDSGESLLTDSSKVEEATEFQKVEGSGCDDARVSETCTDVDKVQVGAISGEFDQAGLVSPGLKRDGSLSSTSSIEEVQEVVSDKDHDTANHTSNIIEETIVVVKHDGETKGRSLTLEEATDTILFCSSIVHSLAHSAATIAIEKETRLDPVDDSGSWPLIPATRKSDTGPPELQTQTQTTTKRPSKSQRSRQKKEAETDPTKSPSATETQGQTGQPKTRIVGFRDSNNGESKKPPMLESKCNCIIM